MKVSESSSEQREGLKRKVSKEDQDTRKSQKTSDSGGAKRKASDNEDSPRKISRVSKLDHGWTGWNRVDSTTASTSEETSRQDFHATYEQLELLGEGGFGSVFAGIRREDNFPVAIKRIHRDRVTSQGVDEKDRTLPLEVVIMLKMAKGPVGKSAAIALLDFYDLHQELILVLERPDPCCDLFEYINYHGGFLLEETASFLLKQLVEAALDLQSQNIFHRDIKLENILIETGSEVPRVRLIDFGLSCFSETNASYSLFSGTEHHIPPEWYDRSTYTAGPTTVWQVGIVLYEMLHEDATFKTNSFLGNELTIDEDLSLSCQDILRLCLAEEPEQRPSLEQLLRHPWLA
ncbi:serine/threonine-protein kinase pim-1-like [Pagrus major]|uniref:serine/threonine-protein kinase pim-1-like n=1 Tax=Pagrus major TaxID=143350 RepID=UPI003CC84991